ncbi:MAG: DUF4115 domain-containing protein [Chloroflexi bacterium]|nr:DUF4115 domain-containing protein [Chloroflexota bacterium]
MDSYSLGLLLREAREAKELTIGHAVTQLRIRRAILEDFEKGEFELAGVPEVQIRGLLRIYARYLALDEVEILSLYDQMRIAQQQVKRRRLRRRTAPAEKERPGTQPLQESQLADQRSAGCRRIMQSILVILLSLVALAVIVFVALQLLNIEGGAPSLPADTPSPPPVAATATPTPTAMPPSLTPSNRAQYTGSGVLISLLLTQRSWLQIRVDGAEQYTGLAAAGTLLEYSAREEISLTAGNALALDVIWNGEQQPPIGLRGQRVDIRYTSENATVTLGPGSEPSAAPISSPAATARQSVAEPTATVTALIIAEPTNIQETVPAAVIRPKASPLPTHTASPRPIDPPTATKVPPSRTPLPSETPLPSATPTIRNTPLPTAILPPHVTQVGLPPTKPIP